MGESQTYSSAEVSYAIGVSHGTFGSWLARGHLSFLPAGPGTGRSRKYTIEDAFRIAVIAELEILGISIGTAAKYAQVISVKSLKGSIRWGLSITGDTNTRTVLCGLVPLAESWLDAPFRKVLAKLTDNSVGAGFLLDITALLGRVERALADPNLKVLAIEHARTKAQPKMVELGLMELLPDDLQKANGPRQKAPDMAKTSRPPNSRPSSARPTPK